MRTEALNNKYVYGTPIQGSRLVLDLADMHQKCTQLYVRRPYGVGLLIATYDQTGPHLYLTEPSGDDDHDDDDNNYDVDDDNNNYDDDDD
jgi:20S proteasome subunit alpha 6